jgi:hypothetical protein
LGFVFCLGLVLGLAHAVPEYADAVILMKHAEALAIGEAMRFDHLGLVNCSFHKVLKDGKLVAEITIAISFV